MSHLLVPRGATIDGVKFKIPNAFLGKFVGPEGSGAFVEYERVSEDEPESEWPKIINCHFEPEDFEAYQKWCENNPYSVQSK